MIRLNAIRVLAFLAVLGLMTTGAGAETLDEALIAAYQTNPTLLAERAKLKATDELVAQAQAGWRPTVSVTGSAGKTDAQTDQQTYLATGIYTARLGQIYANETVGLTITQPLYRGGRTVAQTEQADATVKAERETLAVTEESILLAAGVAYFDVVRAQSVLSLSINAEHVLERLRDVTDDRFQAGEVTRTDVEQALSRLSAAHADRRLAEANLRSARAEYVQAVGHPPGLLDAPRDFGGMPDSLDIAVQQSLDDNPQVLAARFNYDSAKAGIDLVAGELLPSVALTGSAIKGYNYAGPGTLERVGEAVINLTIPLYQQGQEYARLRAQKHSAGQAQIEVDVARRDSREAATQAWETWQAAIDRVAAYQAQVHSAQLVLDGVQREAQLGARTVVETLNAEQELVAAEVNLAQARHDGDVAAFQLRSAVGRLTAKSLALAVDIYDPVKHFREIDGKWIGTGISSDYGDGGK